jgi:hypothetical protein
MHFNIYDVFYSVFSPTCFDHNYGHVQDDLLLQEHKVTVSPSLRNN